MENSNASEIGTEITEQERADLEIRLADVKSVMAEKEEAVSQAKTEFDDAKKWIADWRKVKAGYKADVTIHTLGGDKAKLKYPDLGIPELKAEIDKCITQVRIGYRMYDDAKDKSHDAKAELKLIAEEVKKINNLLKNEKIEIEKQTREERRAEADRKARERAERRATEMEERRQAAEAKKLAKQEDARTALNLPDDLRETLKVGRKKKVASVEEAPDLPDLIEDLNDVFS